MDFKEIINAWIAANNPNEDIKILAEKRLEICKLCEHRKEILKKVEWTHVCGKCGCPVNKKIFSENYGACPVGKWDDLDFRHMKFKKEKTTI